MFSVPYFKSSGLSMTTSVGTAAACGIPIALFASLGYFFMGMGNPSLPNLSFGYIYLPAVFGISITSIFAAKYGAQIAHMGFVLLEYISMGQLLCIPMIIIGFMILGYSRKKVWKHI